MYPNAGPSSSAHGIVQSHSISAQQPLEHLTAYGDEFAAGMDEHEQYIYVTYPSGELKKRFSDRYDDPLLLLTNDKLF